MIKNITVIQSKFNDLFNVRTQANTGADTRAKIKTTVWYSIIYVLICTGTCILQGDFKFWSFFPVQAILPFPPGDSRLQQTMQPLSRSTQTEDPRSSTPGRQASIIIHHHHRAEDPKKEGQITGNCELRTMCHDRQSSWSCAGDQRRNFCVLCSFSKPKEKQFLSLQGGWWIVRHSTSIQ